MAQQVNYGTGFLPQNLYQNLLDIQKQGLAERNRRERERASKLGGVLGSFARMDTGRSEEAEEDFLTKRDEELARMKAGLAKIKPRLEPELYEQQQKRISDFERGSQAALDKFKDSGFLGLGRDRDALQLPEYERKAEGFDSAGVTAAREQQKQMVAGADEKVQRVQELVRVREQKLAELKANPPQRPDEQRQARNEMDSLNRQIQSLQGQIGEAPDKTMSFGDVGGINSLADYLGERIQGTKSKDEIQKEIDEAALSRQELARTGQLGAEERANKKAEDAYAQQMVGQAEAIQGAEKDLETSQGFLANREQYREGVKADAQQQLDEALAKQEGDRADMIYNPELGVYQSRESYKPIADYEEEFDRMKRKEATKFEKVSINGVETTLDDEERSSLMKTLKDKVRVSAEAGQQKITHTDNMGFTREITVNELIREEGVKDKLAEFDQQLTSAEIQKLARLDEAEVDRIIKRLPRIEAVQKKIDLDRFADLSKAKREEKILDAFDEAYEIQPMMRDALRAELKMKSEVELNAFMKKFKQESGLTLEADLKRMGAVAELKRKIQKDTLADTELTKAQRAKQVGDILAAGGAELSLKVSEMISRSGVDIETARRKIVELGPLETQQLVNRINETKEPEAQAAALKTAFVEEAKTDAEVTKSIRMRPQQIETLRQTLKEQRKSDYESWKGLGKEQIQFKNEELVKQTAALGLVKLSDEFRRFGEKFNPVTGLSEDGESIESLNSQQEYNDLVDRLEVQSEIKLDEAEDMSAILNTREAGRLQVQLEANINSWDQFGRGKREEIIQQELDKAESLGDIQSLQELENIITLEPLKQKNALKAYKDRKLADIEAQSGARVREIIQKAGKDISDEDIKTLSELGSSPSEKILLKEFGKASKKAATRQNELNKLSLPDNIISPRRKFEIAQRELDLPATMTYENSQAKLSLITNLINSGETPSAKMLEGVGMGGMIEEVKKVVEKKQEPFKKEALMNNLVGLVESSVAVDKDGKPDQAKQTEALKAFQDLSKNADTKKLLDKYGYTEDWFKGQSSVKLRAFTKELAGLKKTNSETALNLAKKSYYDAQTKTEGGDIAKLRTKALFEGIARIQNNEGMLPADKKEAIKGLRKYLDPYFGQEKFKQIEEKLGGLVEGNEKIIPPPNPPSKERLEPPKFTKPQTPVSSGVEQIFTSANPAMRERLQLTQNGAFRANTPLDRFVGEFTENGRTANTMMELISGAGGVEELARRLANASDPLNEAKELMQNMGRSSTHLSTPMKAQLNAIAEGYRALKPSPTTDMGFLP